MSTTDTAAGPRPAPGPTASTGPVGPAKTSFDLLDGAFLKVRRARLIQLVAVGVMILAAVAVASRAFMVRVDASSLDRERVALETQLPQLRQQLAEEADTGDLTREEMENHLDTVGVALVTVLAEDVPLNATVQLLRGVLPPGAELSDVSFDGRKVSFQVGLATYQGGRDLAASLPGAVASMITNLNFQWSGGNDGVTMTYTGTLTPRATTPRASLFASRLQLDLAQILAGDDDEAAASPAPEG